MKLGYARCSTLDQNLDWQIDALTKEGCDRIFQEKFTGTRKDRPELLRMMDMLREGDTVIICELTRLSRSVKDLFDLVEQVEKADCVCFGTLGLRSPESHDTIVELLKHTKPGAMKFFDINIRGDHYSKELIEELLSYATVFKLNDAELQLLRDMFGIRGTSDDEACRWFLTQYGLDYIILTGGATFSTIIAKTGDSSTLSTPHVQVADTVGAGDSFSGTFAAKILTGASLEEAHRAAVNTAAFVCTNDGAWPEYPAQIPDYLAEAGM